MSLDERFRDGKEWSCVFKENVEGSISAFDMKTLLSSKNIQEIDFLKIDIEGAEQMLLENLHTASQFLPKTKFVSFELHPEYLTPEQAQITLEHFGFEVVFRKDVSYAWNKFLI